MRAVSADPVPVWLEWWGTLITAGRAPCTSPLPHLHGRGVQPKQYDAVVDTLRRERAQLLQRVDAAELAVNASREVTGSLYNRVETFKALKARNRGTTGYHRPAPGDSRAAIDAVCCCWCLCCYCCCCWCCRSLVALYAPASVASIAPATA